MRFDHCSLQECGVARFLSLLDGPWATLIVRELLTGPHRFNEILTALPGISAHTLTSRLRKFESHGLVTRTAYAEIPPRVVYELTPLGTQLRPVLDAMNSWAMTVPPSVFGLEDSDEYAGKPADGVTAASRTLFDLGKRRLHPTRNDLLSYCSQLDQLSKHGWRGGVGVAQSRVSVPNTCRNTR